MIYRYDCQQDYSHFRQKDWERLPMAAGCRGYLGGVNYTLLFEPQPWLEHAEWVLYKAPKITRWMIPVTYRYELKRGEIDDVLRFAEVLLLSQPARDILERLDPGAHQFIPISLLSPSGALLSSKQYYAANIRRHISIAPQLNSRAPASIKCRYILSSKEEKTVPVIADNPSLFNALAHFPIWQFAENRHRYYLSEELVSHFHKAGLTGLRIYTELGGQDGEAICPLWDELIT